MIIATQSPAATYYMATSGSDSNAGSSSYPFLTLKRSMQAMTAGDTLIIRDGTYTGTSNQITNSQYPPVSATTWTTIKAEHDGGVTFDGQGTRDMLSVTFYSATNCYWKFEGIIWCKAYSTVVYTSFCNYIKFLRCGAYDAGSGNTGIFIVGRGCNYVLLEGCYAWGSGRTAISAYGNPTSTTHIIFRNCVGRIDRVSASDPIYTFGMYSVDYGLVQNCIAIDNDQTSYYLNNGGDWAGGFTTPSTDKDATNITFENCIVLNSHIGGIFTSGNVYHSYDTTFRNCIVWDVSSKSAAVNINMFRGYRNVVDHCTFGVASMYTGSYGLNGWAGTSTTRDSIVYNYIGDHCLYNMSEDYSCLFGNTQNFGDGSSAGSNTLTTTNPIYNAYTNTLGALKYITRIESNSNLSGKGSTGDIGANLTTLQGVSETLWGEIGYDSNTGVSMWPFPNENLIKIKMAAYTGGGVNGARGFCVGKSKDGSEQTLTKYIWEYLGNQIPDSIYATQIPNTLSAPTGVSVQIID